MHWLFRDRADAGRELARRLSTYSSRPGLLVLAVPRGGVPVGYEIARTLGAPLDVLLIRKLGVPGYPELAMGAIAGAGLRVMNQDILGALDIPESAIEDVVAREKLELLRRERVFRSGRPPLDVQRRNVVVVDDGLATGATIRAALEMLRLQRPASLIVAVPVAAEESCERVRELSDAFICLATPEPFDGIGAWYHDFSQLGDADVCALLEQAWHKSVKRDGELLLT